MDLHSSYPGVSSQKPYHEWLELLNPDQKRFLDASTETSIRLRGPAGSGKTLSLIMKAVHETLEAREKGDELRVLYVTHSWALASEVQESVVTVGQDFLNEIDVFPLLEIAEDISPRYTGAQDDFRILGDDSLSGKTKQLAEIRAAIDEFVRTDWITFKGATSAELSQRIDANDSESQKALEWDLLVEFGSVLGASAIFPSAGAFEKYSRLSRSHWMMPLEASSRASDLRVVYEIYSLFMQNLDSRLLLTSDQVLADVLSHLETHSWNRARRARGYDLIFADEFHLFSPLERHVLHYLSRDTSRHPRIFMALDPRQSPSAVLIGTASDSTRSLGANYEDDYGRVENFDLGSVHRYTPEILALLKHIDQAFPTLALGSDWEVDFSAVESLSESGAVPKTLLASSDLGERYDIISAVEELYPKGRVAIAIVDSRDWENYAAELGALLSRKKYHVSALTSRTDIELLRYRGRGVIIGPAEYLAGLQFESVLVAGLPDMSVSTAPSNRITFLSRLYLAISRAERQVKIFANKDAGGIPEVIASAASKNAVNVVPGNQM